MLNLKNKFKKGAASFYIVAFSTLILVIIAASFAMVIISEVTRTSNDDLSQSAYDAALAGVEDAKLAYMNYRKCVESGATASTVEPSKEDGVTCANIMYWMEHPDCDMVAKILGRSIIGDNGVMVSETSDGNNNLSQYYTCVKIETSLSDYRASLSASNPAKVIRVDLKNPEDAKNISSVTISWYSTNRGNVYNFSNEDGFPPLSEKIATPPTLSVQLIQTADNFSMDDFTYVVENGTNRGTVYLVPTEGKNTSDPTKINADKIVKSNNQSSKNEPIKVACNIDSTSEYACSAKLELPSPVKDNAIAERSSETFMFVVSIPYGQPDTDISLEFHCGNNKCATNNTEISGGDNDAPVTLSGVQVLIDSTGRANDIYRRVETRLETTDTGFPYPFYAIQILRQDEKEAGLNKTLTPTSEYNFQGNS